MYQSIIRVCEILKTDFWFLFQLIRLFNILTDHIAFIHVKGRTNENICGLLTTLCFQVK